MKVDIDCLKMHLVSKGEFPLFSFLEFSFFWNSPDGKAMPLLFDNPAWLMPLIAVPYMLAAWVHNFRGTKYFIRTKDEVAGTAILKVRQDTLILHSLAVSPTKRKRGVGLFVLVRTEKLAKKMNLAWIELEVLKRNVPAQRLYWKFGFKLYDKRRLSLVLRKNLSSLVQK